MKHGTRSRYVHHRCRCDECRTANTAHYRTWRHDNLERARESNRRWARANPEKERERVAEWRRGNPERAREYTAKWQRANPESVRALKQRRRAAKAGARGSHSTAQSQARWDYYGGLCWMCGATAVEMDHVIALASGGSNWPANLRPACKSCNSRKRDRRWEKVA